MRKSLCHYCAFGIVYQRKNSFVNGVTIECMQLRRKMPDDVFECTQFRDRFAADAYGRNFSDEAANHYINGHALIIDARPLPEQYV